LLKSSNENIYGAFELKKIYSKNYSIGILLGILIHLFVFVLTSLMIDSDQKQNGTNEKLQVVTYVELGPPPSIIENPTNVIAPKTNPTFGNLKPAKKGETTSEFKISEESNSVGNVKVEEKKLPEKKIEPVDETYYVSVDVMPEPFGGMEKLQQSVSYPEEAKKNSIIGKVFVKAFINETGEVTRAEIVKGLGYGCDEEALWVIKNTRFRPAKKNGKPVKVQMVIPITFR